MATCMELVTGSFLPIRTSPRQGEVPSLTISPYDGHDTYSKGPTWTYASASPKLRVELNIELADDLDREALKTKIEAALAGTVDVLWLTDKRNRDVGVSAAKIAYIEIGSPDGDRKIGFSG